MPSIPDMPDYENTIHVEVEGTKDAKKLNLEDKAEIIIKGTIAGITQRSDFDDKERKISVIELTNYSSKVISKGDTSFSDLADD